MGNEESCGFGVLNLSTCELTIGLSMAATHYFENKVGHGKIFYRWPGAVAYTVFAQVGPEITNYTCAREIAQAVGTPISAIIGAAVVPVAIPAFISAGVVATAGSAVVGGVVGAGMFKNGADAALQFNVEPSHLYTEKKGCYGGGTGSWLIVEGGPRTVPGGGYLYKPLTIKEVTQKDVMSNGSFTKESHDNYYKKPGLPLCLGHTCGKSEECSEFCHRD